MILTIAAFGYICHFANLYLRSSLSRFQSRTSNIKTDPYTYLVLKHPHSEAARGFPLTLRHAAEQ
jgi:hypothetical protein